MDTEDPQYPTYNIETIEELYKVATIDNVDRLCDDLRTTLRAYCAMGEVRFDMIPKKMTWCDDGKTDVTFSFIGPDGEKYAELSI